MTTPQAHIPGLIFMLAGLTALGPLSTDAYLPAIPSIAEGLGVSIHDVELSVSLFLGGFSCGQLTGGPLSDRYGRRVAVFSGLCLFFIGALLASLADSISALWTARILQGFGGGLSVVNSMAIIRDRHSGRESAQAMGKMASILMLAPLLAPVLGTLLLELGSWRLVFYFLSAYAFIILVLLMLRLPETRRKSSTPQPNPFRAYLNVLTHRSALGYLCSVACAYAGMFAFITGSPGSYIDYYGASPALYTVLFGLNIITLLGCNQLNIRLLHRFSTQQLLQLGQRIQLACALLLTLSFVVLDAPLPVIVALIMVFIGVQGFVIANGMAGTSEFFPHSAATATALIGACGFGCGALAGSLVGLLGDGTPLPMILVMLSMTVVGNVLGSWLLPRKQTAQTCQQ
ncbi:multidrug effflux MFS transporter [Marinobacterium sp. AK62]|uniref:Bcr/CflA family efflux transporter n=1 Tax=Marinobacterium alkalitolerans TaxID=1542925 RepID=A0ABS3ZDB9_9GAMM|nr:multidrug effflux MFS transporter [Marinobacterium alkalitolerans]MBP0049692.1 multidrug effflux MFS transporter [Marinobacterium alkalitolerans]